MPVNHYGCTVEWSGAHSGPTLDARTFSRDSLVTFSGRPPLPMSAAPEYQGDGTRVNPEELFVASLSTCQMLTYLFEAARAGVHVLSYTDEADGELTLKDGRMRMVRVTLRPNIVIDPNSDMERATALVDRAHDGCFIANSINCAVELAPVVSARS